MDASPPSSTPGTSKKPEKAYSCVRCFDRKVKCNKQIPCTACTKTGVECVFRQPAPPRRRKKRTQEELLLARLRKCEDLLKSHGLSPDSVSDQSTDAIHEPNRDEADHETKPDSGAISGAMPGALGGALSHQSSSITTKDNGIVSRLTGSVGGNTRGLGKLFVEQGRSKFFESNLYLGLDEELHANDDLLQPSSADESESTAREFANAPQSIDFMLGISPTNTGLKSLHPLPEQIYKLWQVYLDNVNPLSKIIHQPTLQSAIFDASFNLDKVGRGLEALMFAIYAAATYTLTEKECAEMLHEDKTNLLARYRLGLRKALVQANFLATSEIAVLQAFTIYLMSMRILYDAQTMWILSGVASRLGQSIGLHRDGTTLGLSPFDTEMRRRLWWQIIILDSRSAELSGSERPFSMLEWDIQVPANVNDADLFPQMTQAPVSVVGKATEMISCSLRYDFGVFYRQFHRTHGGDGQLLNVSTAKKDEAIQELENKFEEKYVRYCDPSIPIHFHTLIVGRVAIYSMRLMAHHPRHRSDKNREQSKEELDMVFTLAMKIIECDNMCHSSRVFRRFLWHTHVYFQWQAFIYLLGALRTRTEGAEVDAAWQQIEETYEHHPTFLSDTKRPLHVVTGNLCLRAWKAREAALARAGMAAFPPSTPGFVQTLRQQRWRKAALAPEVSVTGDNLFATTGQTTIAGAFPAYANTNADMAFGANGEFDADILADFSMEDVSPMNWEDWDALVIGHGTSQLQDWTNLPGLSEL
jgi:Fungal specific transcription factor domain/Fungal Zn(2)-Cys(6) binuclear cluster domain